MVLSAVVLMVKTSVSGPWAMTHPKPIWYGNRKHLHVHITYHYNKGQMFMALDPSVFVDDFPTRLNGFMTDLRNLEPVSSVVHTNKVTFTGMTQHIFSICQPKLLNFYIHIAGNVGGHYICYRFKN